MDVRCTFCIHAAIMKDENLGVAYCEYHAKGLHEVVEKIQGEL